MLYLPPILRSTHKKEDKKICQAQGYKLFSDISSTVLASSPFHSTLSSVLKSLKAEIISGS